MQNPGEALIQNILSCKCMLLFFFFKGEGWHGVRYESLESSVDFMDPNLRGFSFSKQH